ncbi:MAG: osmotically inducible protein OsmC [Nitrospira sp.]|nr:MAG: osmotically inducible protein OsmC [Nitrospira sp.]
MSEHKISLEWKRGTEDFSYESYTRDHVLVFEGGVRVPASAAPAYRGNPAHVNPEEGLVAALSSCHMLTFLAVAAKKQFVVDQYSDHAVGLLEKNQKGKLAITRVICVFGLYSEGRLIRHRSRLPRSTSEPIANALLPTR